MQSFIRTSVGGLSDALGAIAAICMAGLFLLMITEVIARSFFSFSLGFSWEVSGYLMGAVMFLGAAQALKVGAHVRITLLLGLLPKRYAYLLDLLSTSMATLLSFYMFRAFLQMTLSSWDRGTVSATVNAIPLYIPQSSFALGMLVLTLQLTVRVIRLLCDRESYGSNEGEATGASS